MGDGSRGLMTKRILIVESDGLNCKLFCDALAADGFTVEPVMDGSAAIETARHFRPNLIIMDVQPHDPSRLALLAAFKKDAGLRDVPILALTAYAGKGDEQRIRALGAAEYLAKPIPIGPFMISVRSVLDRAMALRHEPAHA